MREIKFRAWHKKDKKIFTVFNWHKGDAIDFVEKISGFNGSERFFIGKDVELMQYTGLKDKNGKEIYEGDHIKYNDDNILVVAWDHFGWAFFDYIDGVGCNEMWADSNCEVVGNIYEHDII